MEHLILLLKSILIENDIKKRKILISEFQNIIWNTKEIIQNNEIDQILIDTADILDYYESDSDWRNEDSAFFGDEKLKREIKEALRKLENLKN